MIRSQTPASGEEKLLQEAYWRQMIETLTSERSQNASGSHASAHAAPYA